MRPSPATSFCLLVCSLLTMTLLGIATKPAQTAVSSSVVRHFVALRFKDTTTKEQAREIETAFQSLKSKIPQVVSIEWGPNISPENLNKGFTDGFLVTFQSEKDRDAYLSHPEHLKFKDKALPLVSDVFVMDFCEQR